MHANLSEGLAATDLIWYEGSRYRISAGKSLAGEAEDKEEEEERGFLGTFEPILHLVLLTLSDFGDGGAGMTDPQVRPDVRQPLVT